MGETFFIADLHFQHPKLLSYEPARSELGSSMEAHDEELVRRWNQTVSKRDVVWILGDFCMQHSAIERFVPRLNGIKKLVGGNHDVKAKRFIEAGIHDVYFYPTLKTGEVLTHVPVHPAELLRWGTNIHGHKHTEQVLSYHYNLSTDEFTPHQDKNYICVSAEQTGFKPVSYEDLPK